MSNAEKLAALLNEGVDQCDALARLGIDEDDAMGEEFIGIGDPVNDVIDLCDGTYVQRHGARSRVDPDTRHVSHIGGRWLVHTYE